MHFISTLAVILIAAAVFSVLSRWLNQSLALGYIIAGILVGPYVGLFPSINGEGVEQWAEIGVIFFFFGLGLEFSFKKLIKVGIGATLTDGLKCLGMLGVGYLFGQLIHYTLLESLFLGSMLAMSFPSVIVKSYEEMGLREQPHSSLLFGSLVVENMIAVILMVGLTTLSTTQHLTGSTLAMTLIIPILFIALWFLVGIWIIPFFLKWIRRYLNNEILMIFSFGLCFVMVAMVDSVGFSSAIGAFIMGSILTETLEGERVEHAVHGVKDLFEAIFFVSVGVMVNPTVIVEHWRLILVLSVLIILGVIVFATIGGLLAGQGLVNSLHVSFSMAQVGEFAFIIAALGYSMGVMRDFLYPIIVSVSVVTIFTTPYLIRLATPVSSWLMDSLPNKWKQRFMPMQRINFISYAAKWDWWALVRRVTIRISLFGITLLAILYISHHYLGTWVRHLLPQVETHTQTYITVGVTLLFVIPIAIAFSTAGETDRRSVRHICSDNSSSRFVLYLLTWMQVTIAALFVTLACNPILPNVWWGIGIWQLISLILFLFWRFSVNFSFIERSFFNNYNERDNAIRAAKPITTAMQNQLANYDVKVVTLEISPTFKYIGQTLRQMPFRHIGGANVVELMRGGKCIRVPRGDEVVFPFDRLAFVGSDSQIQLIKKTIDDATEPITSNQIKPFEVIKIIISRQSEWCDKTLRECDFRKYGCLAVAIIHNGVLNTNPKADDWLRKDDILYLSGEKESLDYLSRINEITFQNIIS